MSVKIVKDPAGAAGRVDRDRLEASLERLRSRVDDPARGLFGPDSIVWRIYREQAVNVGGGAALLLQTAHPYVAHAVREHSAYRSDPFGRTERTFRALYAWVFGDLDRAFAAARRTWGVHQRVRGSFAARVGHHAAGDAYAANAPHALLWVHSTLWHTPWRVHEMLFGPLTRDERARFYEETRLFALLFGLDEDQLPETFEDFLEYNEHMVRSGTLEVDDASREVARYVLTAPSRAAAPAFEYLRIMTAGLLPPEIRHGYRFRWGRLEETVFDGAIRALRAGTPLVPSLLRHLPLYRRASHRVAATRPGRIERRFDRAYKGLEKRMMSAMGPRMPRAA